MARPGDLVMSYRLVKKITSSDARDFLSSSRYLNDVLDAILHVAHNIGHRLHVEPGVLEPVDGGLGEVEAVVGVGDRVEGEDDAEAVPGGAGHDAHLGHAGQLQPHSLLQRRHEDVLLAPGVAHGHHVGAAAGQVEEALLVHKPRVTHSQPVILSHNLLEHQQFTIMSNTNIEDEENV